MLIIFTAKPSLPENYQEHTWQKLKEAVVAIQTSTPITYCLEELYQAVENMCSHKMDSQLYVNLTGLAESHVKANIRPFLAERIDKLVSCYIYQAPTLYDTVILIKIFVITAVSKEGE